MKLSPGKVRSIVFTILAALAIGAGSSQASSCTPPPAGLVGWWKGDGSTLDNVAANNGVNQNISFSNGVVGQAFACDPENYSYGTYTGIQIADQPAYALTNSLTIEGWIRPRGDSYIIFWRGDHRPGLDPYFLGMQGSNTLFNICDADGNSAAVIAPVNYFAWTHVAATLDGSTGTLNLYTNGVLAAYTNTSIRPFGALLPDQSPGVGIGNVNDGGNNFPFIGDIDEISLYNHALSAGEIQAIYNAGSAGKCAPAPPTPPEISGFTPASGASGTLVTISGTNFSPIVASNIVRFGAFQAAVLSASPTLLTAVVPARAIHSPLTVTVNGLTAYASLPFLTTFPNPASRVVVWGDNLDGQTNIPSGLTNVIAIAAGAVADHSLALKTDGTVVAWGYNYSGQATVPAGLNNVIEIAGGYAHNLVLKGDGTVAAWGYNNNPYDSSDSNQGTVPASLSHAIAIAAGWYHSLALRPDGTVLAWGANSHGETNVPVGLSNVVAIAGAPSYSMALKIDGTVAAWGSNFQNSVAVPMNPPPGLSNVVAIAAGYFHCLALKTDGTIVSWGDNTYGQTNVPAGLANVVAIAAGAYHNLAVKADGTLVAWGINYPWLINVPAGLSNVVAVSAGYFHSLALMNDSSVGTPLISSPPIISNLMPAAGTIGTVVTISGTNFSPTAASNIVYFGAVRATVSAASPTSLTVTVPAGATYAPVTVTVGGLIAYANAPFLVTFAGNGSTTLSPRLDLPAIDGAGQVVYADMDGDGKPDLLVASGNQGISVYQNISTSSMVTAATFAPRVDLPLPTGLDAITAADVDGDGKLDIVFLNRNSNQVGILKNISNGGTITTNSFAAPVAFPTGSDPRGIVVRDLDGDGKPELAVANWGDGTVSVYQHTSATDVSTNTFALTGTFTVGASPQSLGVADLDGDGKPDLITANNNYGTTNSVSLLRNTSTLGNISFAPQVAIAGLATSYCLAIGDLDGDGKLDLVVSSFDYGQAVSVYRNTSTPGSLTTGSFAPHVDFDAGGWGNAVAIGDLDGDGKPDLAVVTQLPDHFSIFKNISTTGSLTTNSLAARVDYPAGWNPNGVAIGDLDGDGRPDISFAVTYAATLSIYQNQLPSNTGSSTTNPPAITGIVPQIGTPASTVTISGTNFSPVAAANIVYFGAVRANVLAASPTSLTVVVPAGATFAPITVTLGGLTASSSQPFEPTFTGNGSNITSSSFAPSFNLPGANGPQSMVIADLDGDGKPDLSFVNGYNNLISIYRNISTNGTLLGPASFAPRLDLSPATNGIIGSSYRLRAVDLDGDGRLDLIVSDVNSDHISIFHNIATPGSLAMNSFEAPFTLSASYDTRFAAAADLDGDGRVDIVALNYGAKTISIYRNVGTTGALNTNSFASPVSLAAPGGPYEAVIADLDGDGKPDLAVANSDSGTVSVYQNFASPGVIVSNSFAPPVEMSGGGGNTSTIIAVDLDGDGKLDLVSGSGTGDSVNVFRNISTGGVLTTNSFAARVDFGTPGWMHTVSVADFNGDSKPDLGVVGELDSYMAIFQNAATPGSFTTNSFAPRVDLATGYNAWGIAVGDLDGDGRPDVVFGNYYDNTVQIYQNVMPFGTNTPPPPTSLIVNGGFENPPGIYPYNVYSTDTPMPGWVIESGTVEINGTYWQAAEGTQSLDLNGIFEEIGTIYQDFATTPGQNYKVRFAYAGNPDCDSPTLKTANAFWNGQLLTNLSFDITGHSKTNMGWIYYEQIVTATATNSRIRFQATSPTFCGLTLDDVSVTPTSQPASSTPPTIISQTPSQVVLLGNPATFNVNVSGSDPLSYFWSRNNVLIPGATNSSYTIANAQLTDSGSKFSCLITNAYGFAASTNATLKVIDSISNDLCSGAIIVTGLGYTNLQSTAKATSFGDPVPDCVDGFGNGVWYQYTAPVNGGLVVDTFGSDFDTGMAVYTGACGSLTEVACNDDTGGMTSQVTIPTTTGTTYFILVGGYSAHTGNLIFHLTHLTPPAFVVQPANQSVAVGGNASFSATLTGALPMSFQWTYLNGTPLVDDGRIAGSTTANLTISNITTADAGSYVLLATNFLGSATSTAAVLNVLVPPAISTQPVGRSVPPGLPTTFSATATGNPTPNYYQWQFNGTNIPGATSSTYTIAAVNTNHLGLYHLVVSNLVGGTVSADAQLTFGPVAAWGRNLNNECLPPPNLSNVVAVAGNYGASLVLRTDGTIAAWGSGIATNIPASASNVVAIAASGIAANYALRSDGSVVGWNLISAPALSNIVSIAAGYNFGYALRAEGTLTNWGAILNPSFPAGLNHLTAIAAGYSNAVALRNNGTIAVSGGGAVTNVPGGLTNVVAIAAGYTYAMALKADGTVVAWGSGTATNLPAGMTNIISISAGNQFNDNFGVAVRSNGKVVAWGDNPLGESSPPAALSNLVSIVGAAAPYHGLALVNDGSPVILHPPVGLTTYAGRDVTLQASAVGAQPLSYQWLLNGTNVPGATSNSLFIPNVQFANAGSYQLFVSNSISTALSLAAPLTVVSNNTLTFLTQITATPTNLYQGGKFTVDGITVLGNGPLRYQWFFSRTNNNYAAVAGATNDTLTMDPALAFHTGNYYLAVSNQFAGLTSAPVAVRVLFARAWGYLAVSNPPVNVTNAIALATGGSAGNGNSSYFALGSDGKLTSWANAGYFPVYAETNVSALSNSFVTAIAAGNQSSLALKSDGTVYAWGNGLYGQTNPPAGLNGVVAISVGGYHDLALKSDGTVVGWGGSSAAGGNFGQATNNPAATNVVAIAAGTQHSLALRADGTVVNWGNTQDLGQIPSAVTNVVAIVAGGNFNAALRANGTVVQWGNGILSYPVPLNLSNVVAISGSGTHCSALKNDGTVVSWGYQYIGFASNNVPADLANVIAITSGGDRDFALFGTRAPSFTVQPWNRAIPVSARSNIVLAAKCAGVQPVRYQWQLNGTNVPNATNDTLILTNEPQVFAPIRLIPTGSYQLIASNAYGVVASKFAKITTFYPLGDALDATNLNWTTTGNAQWFGETNVTHDGVDAVRSGGIGALQETILQTTFGTNWSGRYTFWWKVSSEQYFDTLEFRVNGVTVTNLSGEVDWRQASIPVAAGTNVLQWRYSKDVSFDGGQDAAWVDQFSFVPDPPIIMLQPASQTVNMGSNVTFHVTAMGRPEYGLTYQWRQNGTIVGSSSALTLNNVGRAQNGTYNVTVTESRQPPAGSAVSSNAVLKVLVPQKFGSPTLLPGGTLQFSSTDANGGLLSASDLANFEAQASTNLVNWVTLPDALSLSNGILRLQDSGQSNYNARYYRIIEH